MPLVLASALACGPAVPGSGTVAAVAAVPMLWSPDDATRSATFYADGTVSLTFTLVPDSPPALSADLVAAMARAGWQPLPTQWLNPGMATSFESGWEHICSCVIAIAPDGTRLPPRHQERWTGEWQDEAGNLATYVMASLDGTVRASAGYVPATIAARTRQMRRESSQPSRGR